MHDEKPNSATTLAPIEASLEQLERLADLAAGQYWRAIADLPAVKRSYARSSGGKTVTDGRNPLAGGTVLLVQSLRHVDGHLHTVILAPHPLETDGAERRFLAADFFELFERESDPAAVRRREINALEAKIAGLQNELVEGPKDQPAITPPPSIPSVGQLVAAAPRAEALKKNAQILVEISKARAEWVQGKVAVLAADTATLARFHQEQAAAALAAVEDTLRYADHVASGVKTLGLYTGDGVEVVELCSGAPAPASEPLTLYQRKLYMDEEWLVHLKSGGADYEDLPAFGRALQEDRSLLERILPAPRSAVIMQYRRNAKAYFSKKGGELGDVIARSLADVEKNKPNFETFLLVRNGERVHQVWSELSTQDAQRLFPTKLEVERIFRRGGSFRGLDATRITIADLDFTDALEEHQKAALFYKRLLILIWGLNDRLELFGEFYDRTRWNSWLSADFQASRFRFVTDDEDALVEIRPAFHEWAKQMNAHLQAGSRVVVRWDAAMDPITAPGATSWMKNFGGRTVAFRYKPNEAFGFAVVRAKGTDLVTDVRCRYDGWREVARTEIDAQVTLNRYVGKAGYNDSLDVLCLDAVKAADIDWYLNSRGERCSYLAYVDLFIAARNRLREEERQAEPFVSSLKRAALAASLVPETAEGAQALDAAIEESIRLWRANRFGRAVPAPGDDDYAQVLDAIGAQVYRLLGAAKLDIDGIAAAAGSRAPLRLVSTGAGKLVLYATPEKNELHDFDGRFPWVAAMTVKVGPKGKISMGSPNLVHLEAASAAQKMLHEWPAAHDHLALEKPAERFTHKAFRRFLAAAEPPSDVRALMTAGQIDRATFDLWFTRYKTLLRQYSRGRVVEPCLVVPVGVVSVQEVHKAKTEASKRIDVLLAGGRLSNLLFTLADKAQRDLIRLAVAGFYAHPDSTLERLEKRAAKRSWLGLWHLPLTQAIAIVPEIAERGFVPPARLDVGSRIAGFPASGDVVEALALELGNRFDVFHGSVQRQELGWWPWAPALASALGKAWPSDDRQDRDAS